MAGVTAGEIIILNGTSSSGKTTLASTLQAELACEGECWVVMAIDDFFGKLPHDWVRIGNHIGARADQGIEFELIDGEIERRIGPIGTQVMAAYRGAVGAAARAGLNVIVDEVLLSEEDWTAWQVELRGLPTTWVRVEIDLDTVEARERERGDRVIGMARAQHGIVHRYATYDLQVDTGRTDAKAAAAAVLNWREMRTDPLQLG
jgi:chloramphenicol 3-O phosphotransferase